MDELTAELVRALHAVNRHMPAVSTGLLSASLATAKQHEFARLLTDLGGLLHQHAENSDALAADSEPIPPQ